MLRNDETAGQNFLTNLWRATIRFVRDRLMELAGLAFIFASIWMLLALSSYHPGDPSYNVRTSAEAQNIMGRMGSHFADMTMQSVGLGALVILPILALWGWWLMAKRSPGLIWLRAACLLGAIVSASALAASLPLDPPPPLKTSLGGVVGDWAGSMLGGLGHQLGMSGQSLQILSGSISALALLICFAMAAGLRPTEFNWRYPEPVVEPEPEPKRKRRRKKAAEPEPEPEPEPVPQGVLARLTAAMQSLRMRLFPPKEREPQEEFAHSRWAVMRLVFANWARNASGAPGRLWNTIMNALPFRRRAHRRGRYQFDPRPASAPVAAQTRGIAPAAAPLMADRSSVRVTRSEQKIQVSHRERSEAQPVLGLEPDSMELPPLSLLQKPKATVRTDQGTDETLHNNARMLETVLQDFGVKGTIINVRPGPVVTLYELEPAPGIKSSRVIGLADDIARSMSAISARVAVIPGRNVIGIELPNKRREMVFLRELLASDAYENAASRLTLALGKDISGDSIMADLATMPHLLIAGTTGSGKSVAINTMILSLLYRLTPTQCKLILIDPKMLELSVYEGIPHLLTPVVTDPKKAIVSLKWIVREMEDRYRKMSKLGVRNIRGYNQRIYQAIQNGEVLKRSVQTGFDKHTGEPVFEEEDLPLEAMPFIVVVVDEMADLMLVAGKDIEGAVQRLAQMARAAGIHLITATQRPSVDVITGTIKANFPTRISFQVTSKIDSRTILGEQGAEQLLGQGDMLYMAGGGRIGRVHGPFVSDKEVEQVVEYLKRQGSPDYVDAVTVEEDDDGQTLMDVIMGNDDSGDELYDKAVAVVARDRKASTSYIQRKLQIGYNRAARIMERMEEEGVVSQPNNAGKREVLVSDHSGMDDC